MNEVKEKERRDSWGEKKRSKCYPKGLDKGGHGQSVRTYLQSPSFRTTSYCRSGALVKVPFSYLSTPGLVMLRTPSTPRPVYECVSGLAASPPFDIVHPRVLPSTPLHLVSKHQLPLLHVCTVSGIMNKVI